MGPGEPLNHKGRGNREREGERERAVRSCFTANVLADVVVVVTHALTATSRLERLEVGRLRSRAECPSMLKLK